MKASALSLSLSYPHSIHYPDSTETCFQAVCASLKSSLSTSLHTHTYGELNHVSLPSHHHHHYPQLIVSNQLLPFGFTARHQLGQLGEFVCQRPKLTTQPQEWLHSLYTSLPLPSSSPTNNWQPLSHVSTQCYLTPAHFTSALWDKCPHPSTYLFHKTVVAWPRDTSRSKKYSKISTGLYL